MTWFLFAIFPYIAVTLAVAVGVVRAVRRPFSVSSLSSQLLERRWLYWGSQSFHYGILLVLGGHLLAFLLPGTLRAWNGSPARQLALEITGLGLGLYALVGALILVLRRLTNARIRVVTSPMDLLVWLALLVSLVTGVLTAGVHRYGSTWFTGVFTPYLWSLARFAPEPERLDGLPWLVRLHAFNFFVLLALFPFSRLVHLVTVPVGYLVRPWQLVVANRQRSAGAEPSASARN